MNSTGRAQEGGSLLDFPPGLSCLPFREQCEETKGKDAPPLGDSQEDRAPLFGTLPGTGPGAAVQTLAAASKQERRRQMGLELAAAIVGRPLELIKRPNGESEMVDRITGATFVEDGESWGMLDKETGELLEVAAGPARAIRYAGLLARAADPSNHVAGLMDSGEAGEYEAGASLWKSSLRLDPNWAETLRRRSRNLARSALHKMRKALPMKERYAMSKGYNWRLGMKLVTLTMPHPEGADSLDQVRLLNRAFRHLGKRAEWRAVWAGVKGVEDKLTADGPHVHVHLLVLSRYLDRAEWREAWKACLDTAALEQNWALDWSKGDGLPSVDVRAVKRHPKDSREEVTPDEALDEVSKYITKLSDLLEPDEMGRVVSSGTLLGLCDVARWPRMFELLGRCRRTAPKARACLDTSCISAAQLPKGKPELVDTTWTEALEPEEKAKFECMGINFWSRAPLKPPRPPTWREMMVSHGWHEWLQIMVGRAERGAIFRLKWLKEHNPRLLLVDLSGRVVAFQGQN